MGGTRASSSQLNNTLCHIVKLLRNTISDNYWFVGYGTLLGIIRENQCIDQDDDIDILVSNRTDNYNRLKSMLQQHGFTFTYNWGIGNTTHIIKTNETPIYSSVDFYMCDVDDKGNFYDPWEKTHWLDCWKDGNILTKQWRDVIVNIPNNYETKLTHRYGDWKTKRTEPRFKHAGKSPRRLP